MTTTLEPITFEGRSYQPVRSAQSRPFTLALLDEWKRLDGKDRSWMARGGAFNVPSDIYERIAPLARARVEKQGSETP